MLIREAAVEVWNRGLVKILALWFGPCRRLSVNAGEAALSDAQRGGGARQYIGIAKVRFAFFRAPAHAHGSQGFATGLSHCAPPELLAAGDELLQML